MWPEDEREEQKKNYWCLCVEVRRTEKDREKKKRFSKKIK